MLFTVINRSLEVVNRQSPPTANHQPGVLDFPTFQNKQIPLVHGERGSVSRSDSAQMVLATPCRHHWSMLRRLPPLKVWGFHIT